MATNDDEKKQATFAVVFDLDGVMHKGSSPIDGAVQALQRVSKVPHLFLTNSGGRTEQAKAEHLSKLLGTEIDWRRVIQAHTPMLDLLEEYRQKRLLVVAKSPESARHILDNYGYEQYVAVQEVAHRFPLLYPSKCYPAQHKENSNDDEQEVTKVASALNADVGSLSSSRFLPFDAIFVLEVPTDWGESLQVLCDAVRGNGDIFAIKQREQQQSTTSELNGEEKQIPLFFANPDVDYAAEFAVPRFTCGAFRLCLERLYLEVTGKQLKYTLLGKPHPFSYSFARRYLDRMAQEMGFSSLTTIYAIGDNPLSDIKGANQAGWFSILTRTGCFQSSEDNDRNHPAQFVCPSVVEAIDFILSRESEK
ncbi:HAD-superfamily hydrolase [Balamuthia mandrillaris]